MVCPDLLCESSTCNPGTGLCESQTLVPCCGNDTNEIGEDCDGTDNFLCPASCIPPGNLNECLCVSPNCGDGILDPDDGEECDPPLVPPDEICDDDIDNDADGLVDCEDPDCPSFCQYAGMPDPNAGFDPNQPCTNHRDCRIQFGASALCVSQGTCGFNCRLANMCSRVDRDPAKIHFAKKEGQLDFLTVHGRFAVQREADPVFHGLQFSLSNEHGTIYSGTLLPGQMFPKGKNYHYKDKAAKLTGGILLAKVKYKFLKGQLNMNFRVKAYGDFSSATVSQMTFRVSVDNQGGYLRGDWTGSKNGWKLFFK